jgi:hypothetical protein
MQLQPLHLPIQSFEYKKKLNKERAVIFVLQAHDRRDPEKG